MKKNRVYSIVSYTINLVLLGVIIISNKGIILNKNTITLKDMNESTQIADKEKAIDDLNTSHSEYESYINTSKTNLAKAITNAGVSTSGTDSLETMITNVSKIVSTKTNDATATADKILSGNTAYVKGNKVTGTMENKGAVTASINSGETYTIPKGYHNGSGKVTAAYSKFSKQLFTSFSVDWQNTNSPSSLDIIKTFDFTSVNNYEKFSVDSFCIELNLQPGENSGNITSIEKTYKNGILTYTFHIYSVNRGNVADFDLYLIY